MIEPDRGMVEAGVSHRQSGIGASLGRPVPGAQHKGISIMKIVIIVTAALVAMLSVAASWVELLRELVPKAPGLHHQYCRI